ncbi:hypothetical protein QBC34DRAFT_34338 [Podospora aff. communis PSN243]|uniref:Uncharacterized protein n=1 Tax=Podospora aff. communis PSN243 TaxID=3040156 RepID=A0AAV9GYG8_9PEZI|nr:hypothetical protein QBC34DRAFT_34338 [Podospora aff. communis PSN243]
MNWALMKSTASHRSCLLLGFRGRPGLNRYPVPSFQCPAARAGARFSPTLFCRSSASARSGPAGPAASRSISPRVDGEAAAEPPQQALTACPSMPWASSERGPNVSVPQRRILLDYEVCFRRASKRFRGGNGACRDTCSASRPFSGPWSLIPHTSPASFGAKRILALAPLFVLAKPPRPYHVLNSERSSACASRRKGFSMST